MFKVPVRRGTMKDIIKAVQELERRGYDYLTPIKKIYKCKTTFNSKWSYKGDRWATFDGMEDHVSYECWMKKVD